MKNATPTSDRVRKSVYPDSSFYVQSNTIAPPTPPLYAPPQRIQRPPTPILIYTIITSLPTHLWPHTGGQTVESYLILPVQRVPRYKLLLSELRKRTPKDHPDYAPLEEAIAKVNAAAHVINDTLKDREILNKLFHIQSQFVGKVELVRRGRKFEREGVLTKICRRGHKQFYFHLFSDALVYSESTMMGYKFHRAIELATSNVKAVEDTDRVKNAFQISSKHKSFVAYVANAEDKVAWLADLQRCLADAKGGGTSGGGGGGGGGGGDSGAAGGDGDASQRGSDDNVRNRDRRCGSVEHLEEAHAAVWVPDSNQSACTICTSKFTFFNRRHHCRRCGALVCADCSKQRRLLEHMDATHKLRVCDKCCAETAQGERCLFRVRVEVVGARLSGLAVANGFLHGSGEAAAGSPGGDSPSASSDSKVLSWQCGVLHCERQVGETHMSQTRTASVEPTWTGGSVEGAADKSGNVESNVITFPLSPEALLRDGPGSEIVLEVNGHAGYVGEGGRRSWSSVRWICGWGTGECVCLCVMSLVYCAALVAYLWPQNHTYIRSSAFA